VSDRRKEEALGATCLSILKDGILVVCANPVFLTSDPDGGTVTFEVFEADSSGLKSRLGSIEHYCLDGEPFLGKITSIEPCRSTHVALSLMRDRPTMRIILTVHKMQAALSS
jgi:hypothetical protein